MANQWYFIQWYSLTGVYGGTIWILLLGYCFYKIYKNDVIKYKKYRFFTILLILPLLISLLYYFDISNTKRNNFDKETIGCFLISKHEMQLNNYEKIKIILKQINQHKRFEEITIIVPELSFAFSAKDLK